MKYDVLPNFTNCKALKQREHRRKLKEKKRLLRIELNKVYADVKTLSKKEEFALTDFRSFAPI